MFFNHSEHKKRGSSLPFVILRLCLSLMMLAIFGLVILQAFRHFSGVDPAESDPQALLLSIATSQGAENLVHGLFNFNFPTSFEEIKSITADPNLIFSAPTTIPVGFTDDAFRKSAPKTDSKFLYRFAVVADSHNDNEGLARALSMAVESGTKFVIGVGDYTDVGSKDEFERAKKVFKQSGLPYYLTAGDHDLWASRSEKLDPTTFFSQAFGSPYQSFTDNNVRFIILNNADNDFGFDDIQLAWLDSELANSLEEKRAVFVFVHEPFYHPSSDHIMGKTNSGLRDQAQMVVQKLQSSGVDEVFSGDVHFSSRYLEPKSGLPITIVGAITSTRNAQKPRFVLVDIFDDGSYNVQDTEIR
ncbi:MAG: metallophosphoesterase [Candidatus Daviesbacteria bacterium]|nr:metallophosphoesterase [Candidatus Daviesbacteria bacterium]